MELAVKGLQSTRSMLLNLTNPTIKEPGVADEILSMRPKGLKEGVIHELASLTMSMMKKGNPVENISNFYLPENLYPFYDIDKNKNKEMEEDLTEKIREMAIQKTLEAGEADGSFMIITEKDSNLQLNQNLIKSQDHHLIIVDFLEIMKPLPVNYDPPIRALHAAYNFLTVLVWNNN